MKPRIYNISKIVDGLSNSHRNKVVSGDMFETDNNRISFNIDSIYLDDATDIYFLNENNLCNLPIELIKNIYFIDSMLSGIGQHLYVNKELGFERCVNIEELDCSKIFFNNKTQLHNIFLGGCSELKTISNLLNVDTCDITVSTCPIQKIDFGTHNSINTKTNVSLLRIANCLEFSSVANIIGGKITALDIDNCFSYTKFCAHNIYELHNAHLDCRFIESFSDFDTFKCLSLIGLYNIHSYNNIVNILLNDTPYIQIHGISGNIGYNNRSPTQIAKYIVNIYCALQNRSEYVMDCVVKLLEHNLPLGAEL